MRKSFAIILAAAFVIAVAFGCIFNDYILWIAGAYWAFVAIVKIAFYFADKRQREVDDDYRKEREAEEALEEAEAAGEDVAEEDVYTRESFGTGKGSNFIGTAAALAVIAVNIALWLLIDPVDQTIVGAVAYLFPFNWIGAIVVTLAEAVFVYVGAIDLYEMITGVATERELEKEETTKKGTAIFTLAVIVIATLLVLFSRFTYEIITEDGYEFHSPLRKSYGYKWEDMLSFEYEAEILLSRPSTLVEFKEENGKTRSKSFELYTFRWPTDACKEKYGMYRNDGLMDYIFLEKYAWVNEQPGGYYSQKE